LSRREFFREGQDYYEAFDLRGANEKPYQPLPDGFIPDIKSNARALQILAARCLEQSCRSSVANLTDKREKGSLRKGAYYLARIVYIQHMAPIDELLHAVSEEERSAKVARKVIKGVTDVADGAFDNARNLFVAALTEYLAKYGGNEDAALKNSAFAESVDSAARQ
jgi:hypothetical protein